MKWEELDDLWVGMVVGLIWTGSVDSALVVEVVGLVFLQQEVGPRWGVH